MPTKRSVSQMRYDKESSRHYGFKLNLRTDADIIARLNEQSSMQGYIKALIRADIAARKTPDNHLTERKEPTHHS